VRKKVPVVTVNEAEEAARLAELSLEASVALGDVAGAVKEGLMAFVSSTGLMVLHQLLEAEMTSRIGPKHAKRPHRDANWHGTTTGPVVLGGRKVSMERPRGRTTDGQEIELDTWAVFSSEDLLTQLVCERMLAGVATRRHADVGEPLGSELDKRTTATGRSSVSRRWKRAPGQGLQGDVHLVAALRRHAEVPVTRPEYDQAAA
jgi:putative transposase